MANDEFFTAVVKQLAFAHHLAPEDCMLEVTPPNPYFDLTVFFSALFGLLTTGIVLAHISKLSAFKRGLLGLGTLAVLALLGATVWLCPEVGKYGIVYWGSRNDDLDLLRLVVFPVALGAWIATFLSKRLYAFESVFFGIAFFMMTIAFNPFYQLEATPKVAMGVVSVSAITLAIFIARQLKNTRESTLARTRSSAAVPSTTAN
jgi:hypothetical protein